MTSSTNSNGSTLVGIFQSRYEAELALDELKQAGFDPDDVGFAIRGEEDVAGGMITDSLLTKDGSGAAKGMVAGGLAGGLFGAAAVLMLPGIGPVLSIGMLASALGFGAAGVATGGLLGAMAGLGVSEEEARVYESEFHAGRAIVAVHAHDRVADARRILARHGAQNIQSESIDPLHSVGAD
jgi:hypothetical protein